MGARNDGKRLSPTAADRKPRTAVPAGSLVSGSRGRSCQCRRDSAEGVPPAPGVEPPALCRPPAQRPGADRSEFPILAAACKGRCWERLGTSCPFGLNSPLRVLAPLGAPERATRGSRVARTPRAGGNVDRAPPGQASAPSGHRAGRRGSSRARPWTTPHPTPPPSAQPPGAPAPPPRARRPPPRRPPPKPPAHYLRLRLVPRRRDAPLRDAAGGREPLRHAGRSWAPPPSRAALRRSGRAARRALHAGRCLPARSRPPHPRPHLPAPPRRAPPLGLPARPALAASARRPGFPTPVPAAVLPVPETARPLRLPSRLVSSSGAAPRGPKSHPRRPPLRASWKSRGGPKPRGKPTHWRRRGAGGGRGGRGAACVGSLGCSQGIGVRNTRGWYGVGGWFSPGPIAASSCASAPPPPAPGSRSWGTFSVAIGHSGARHSHSFRRPGLPPPGGLRLSRAPRAPREPGAPPGLSAEPSLLWSAGLRGGPEDDVPLGAGWGGGSPESEAVTVDVAVDTFGGPGPQAVFLF